MGLKLHLMHYDNERFPRKVPFLLQRQARLVHRYVPLFVAMKYNVSTFC